MDFVTKEEAKAMGFKTFNECPHMCIDLSSLDDMKTLTVKLPNEVNLTINMMKLGENETNIDIKSYSTNDVEAKTKVIGFNHNGNGADVLKDKALYALVIEK